MVINSPIYMSGEGFLKFELYYRSPNPNDNGAYKYAYAYMTEMDLLAASAGEEITFSLGTASGVKFKILSGVLRLIELPDTHRVRYMRLY